MKVKLEYDAQCLVCKKTLPVGSTAEGAKAFGVWMFLCDEHTIPKRGVRDGIKGTIIAVFLYITEEGTDQLHDYDYEVLERLGLWSPQEQEPKPSKFEQ